MPLYSTSTSKPSFMGPVHTKHEPFIVYAKVVPSRGYGRRFEYYRSLERLALKVEDELMDAGFNIATPVAWTPQFGNAPARLTIVGFVSRADSATLTTDDNVPPLTPGVEIIHSGTVDGEFTDVMTPVNGTQTWGDEPTSVNRSRVSALKSAIEVASTGIDIIYIDYNGVKYGQLPNKKGFRSFP